MKFLFYRTQVIILVLALSISCGKKKDSENGAPDCETININLFSLEQDKTLGAQVDSQIVAQYQDTILDPAKYPKAYGHLQRITDNILKGGKVKHKDDFVWQVRIINQDVLNAFCTPGGYIYVYTGIIKYLEHEDDLAGVMGHEIAHADLRHSTKSMTREYGLQTLFDILLGKDKGQLVRIASGLKGLQYSRCHESEADDFSVQYLQATPYRCNGAASFFEKIVASGGSRQPVFLSTHPDPGDRVKNINSRATSLGCKTAGNTSDAQYQDFKNSLPQ
ncbi:MAG TPA: M48 family metalloprotease [Cytophagaceae bacterium]|jgi:predicted Zn-dependent protease